jgi:hypothetical protein
MSSQQNRDRSSIALRLAVAASLALAGAGAQAAEKPVRPVLTGYTDTVGSEALVTGQYDTMIAEVARFKDAPAATPTAYHTNLCVGYIATRQLDEAEKACNAAVRAAKRERTQMSNWMISSRKAYNEQVAIAYANRAVLRMVKADAASAKTDLTKAGALAPDAEFVTRNVAALNVKTALAQATTAQ